LLFVFPGASLPEGTSEDEINLITDYVMQQKAWN